MKITIEAEPKEIAALLLGLAGQLKGDNKLDTESVQAADIKAIVNVLLQRERILAMRKQRWRTHFAKEKEWKHMMLSEDVVKCRFELAASWATGMLSENVGLWPYRMLKFEEVYLLGWVLDMKLLEIDNYISKLVTDRRERSKQEENQ